MILFPQRTPVKDLDFDLDLDRVDCDEKIDEVSAPLSNQILKNCHGASGNFSYHPNVG